MILDIANVAGDGKMPRNLQEPLGLPVMERFPPKISVLKLYLRRCQLVEVLGKLGTVEIEASVAA